MKNFKWKKALALGLSLIVTASAAACGPNGSKGDPAHSGGKDRNGAANAELAKQYVYRYEDLKLGTNDNNDDISIAASRKDGDRIEVLTMANSYGENGRNQTITLHSMKTDGSDIKSTKMDLSDSAAKTAEPDASDSDPEDEAPQESSENGVNARSMSVAVPVPLPEVSVDVDIDDEMDVDDGVDGGSGESNGWVWENTYYSYAILSADCVYSMRNHSMESEVDGVYTYVNEQAVCCWNKEGKLVWTAPIDMSKYQNEEHYSYIYNLLPLGEENLGIILDGDESGIIKISKDGTVSDLKKYNSEQDVFSRNPSFVQRSDGSLLAVYYNEDWSKRLVASYDPEKDSFGTEYDLPAASRFGSELTAGTGTDFLYSDSEGVFGFNLGDQEAKKIMDFVNSDLATYSLNNLVSVDETHFLASYRDPVDFNSHVALFSYVKPEDIPDKKVLVYASIYVDTDVKRQIIRFNRENQEYRIVVKDYGTYNTDEDFTLGNTRLNNDIIAGNVPDIFLLTDSMPVDSYISKGLLANIDELIKNDPELSQQEYVDNVFEAYRVDGVLYRLIPKYTVRTWAGKKSLVGDRTGWNMAEVLEAAKQLTGDKSLFGMDMTRDAFISTMMSFCGSDFVDLKTGKCNFDTQLFVDLLEYAKTLPREESFDGADEEYWEHYWENYQTQYRENRTLLMSLYLSDLSNLKYQVGGRIGEPVSYIGFPTENGSGSFIQPNRSYAIYAKSANLEGAWEYLRFFLTEDYQRNEDYQYGWEDGLSVLKKLVREMVNKTMERPYWEDEEGNRQEFDDYYWINDEQIIIDPFTQEQADELYDFICSVAKPAYYNEEVIKIVTEEAEVFFSGAKSAKDVAGTIQNRVQLYVNENK